MYLAITKIWWLIWSRSKGERKYFSYQVWENIATGIAINILDKLGLLGYLAKPRSISDLESFVNNDAVFSKLVQPLLDILTKHGYISKSPSDTYQVNSTAINELMKTLDTYPHTAFKPLIIAAEKFLDEIVLKDYLEKGTINIHDPRLIAIYREVFSGDFINNQVESIIMWAGGHANFYNKDILLLLSNLGYNAKFMIEKLGYKNVKRIIVAERTDAMLELAKRVQVKLDGETKLLGDLDKVEFITVGYDAEKLRDLVEQNSVDIVMNLIQIYTISDLDRLFSDVYNVLKRNGMFLGGTPMKGSDETSLLDYVARFYGWRKVYTENEIKNLLYRSRFRKIKTDYSFYFRGVK